MLCGSHSGVIPSFHSTGSIIMYGALLLFESEFVHIVAISFTSLILTELLMVALTIQTWHWLMIVGELLSLACYVASLVFLHEFIGEWAQKHMYINSYLASAEGDAQPAATYFIETRKQKTLSALISPQPDWCYCAFVDLEIVRQHSAVEETCLFLLCLWCTISRVMLDIRKAKGECIDKLSWCGRGSGHAVVSKRKCQQSCRFPVHYQGSCVYYSRGVSVEKNPNNKTRFIANTSLKQNSFYSRGRVCCCWSLYVSLKVCMFSKKIDVQHLFTWAC